MSDPIYAITKHFKLILKSNEYLVDYLIVKSMLK